MYIAPLNTKMIFTCIIYQENPFKKIQKSTFLTFKNVSNKFFQRIVLNDIGIVVCKKITRLGLIHNLKKSNFKMRVTLFPDEMFSREWLL